MRLVLAQPRICIVNIHAELLAGRRLLNRTHPPIQKREVTSLIHIVVHDAVVKLHLEHGVAVRVRRCTVRHRRNGRALAAVEVNEEVPSATDLDRCGEVVVCQGVNSFLRQWLRHE